MLYSDFRFSASNSARRLYATAVSLPSPPVLVGILVWSVECVNLCFSTMMRLGEDPIIKQSILLRIPETLCSNVY